MTVLKDPRTAPTILCRIATTGVSRWREVVVCTALAAFGQLALAEGGHDRPPIVLPPGSVAAWNALENARLGEAAVAAWRHGFKTGDFGALISMLDNDVEYRLGIAPHNTIRRGKRDAIEALRYYQSLTIRVDQTPVTPPAFNGAATFFEFVAKGTVGGSPVDLNLLIVFEFTNGRIVRMREYTPPV